MSSETAISVSGLGKCFHVYANPRDRLKQFVMPRIQRRLGRSTKQYFKEFWALRDVSLDLKRGEAVGIIGRNGCGKSTLLQIICGTLQPTHGDVQVKGRIAALLELGSGFNPEFSGRENVFMNSAVLGLSRQETEERFDSIASFADIGDFIEQPVKTYSSGMMVRLAFAVAINVDPDILVIDEALAVGDELFQRKCFSRIEEIRANGATILFVSHSGAQIVQISDRVLLLDDGQPLTLGEPKRVFALYQKMLYAPAHERAAVRQQIIDGPIAPEQISLPTQSPSPSRAVSAQPASETGVDSGEWLDVNLVPVSTIELGSGAAGIEQPEVRTLDGKAVNHLQRGKTYLFCYSARFHTAVSNVRFGMLIKTVSGVELGGASTASGARDAESFIDANSVYQVQFQFCASLNPGTYFFNAGILGVNAGQEEYLARVMDIVAIKVAPIPGDKATSIIDFQCIPSFNEAREIA